MTFYEEHDKELHMEAVNLKHQFDKILKESDVATMMHTIHTHVDMALEKGGLWKQASCKGACSFCCHDTIMMPPLEAEYIQGVLLDNQIIGNAKRKELQSSGEELSFMEKACPYLEDENEEGKRLCSIYEVRPLVCRAHNSTEPIEFCNKEVYPDRFINEGRIIHVEAITVALMMMKHSVDKQGIPMMDKIHELV